MTTPIITTPGRYRTRGGEVVEVLIASDWMPSGTVNGARMNWFRDDGKQAGLEHQFDITEKIDGGAE